MEAEFRVDGAGSDDVAVLHRIVASDANLHGLGLVLPRRLRPSEMGPRPEVLQAVSGPEGMEVAFTDVIAWLGSLRACIKSKIKTNSGIIELDAYIFDGPTASAEHVAQAIGF